jgi:hypothetical protein
MRIFLSYPSQYDKGEGVHFSRVLRRLGHEVCELNVSASVNGLGVPGRVIKGYPPGAAIQDLIGEYRNADLYLYIEPLGLIPRGLESSSIPTACVLCDTHRNLKPRQTLAKLFDHVFLYQRNYVDKFVEHGQGMVHWLPYACDTDFFKDLKLNRDLDIAFIGELLNHRSERSQIIGALARKYCLNEQRYYLQQEIPQVYSRAKIVVNIPAGDDLNFRFFEALSCGALLLTKRIANGQEELFKEDVHYVAFVGKQELLDKVEFYLRNDEERKKIALVGHEEVVRNHTLAQRLQTLLDRVQSGPQWSAPVRKLGKDAVLKLYASVYERTGRVEALLRLAAEQRQNPAMRVRLLTMGAKSFLRRAMFGW